LQQKGRRKWISFDKIGTMHSSYGYSFGEHLWILKIQYTAESLDMSSQMDQSGSMVVGVVNKRFSTQKLFGPIINYSLFKGDIIVRIFLDSNKKRMTVYSPANPNGEVFADLPKDGIFYPAV
jgi:hypothetical protein